MIPYNRFEPEAEKPWKPLGELVRRALTDAPKLIGPDTEGLSPGFHKQSDGKLMYVPDMAVIDALLDPVYEEPEGDNPEDAGVPLDLQCDATRPSGFYATYQTRYDPKGENLWVRHWSDFYKKWNMLSLPENSKNPVPARLARAVEAPHNQSTEKDLVVLRALPDLDAMVQK